MKVIAIYLFIFISVILPPVFAEADNGAQSNSNSLRYSVRYGMGGFSESRSPEGSLGGGEIAFDIHLTKLPLSFSVSQESYTNSANPTHPYEIPRMTTASVFYYDRLNNSEKISYFVGAGAGKINVPQSELTPKPYVSGSYINIASRVHYQIGQHFSLYAHIKHLSADRAVNNIKVIDYNDTVFLFGLGYNFQI